MTDHTKQKILVALDGSDRAFEAIRYISGLPPFQQMHLVLFTILDKIPEIYWDLGQGDMYSHRIKEAQAWQATKQQEIEAYMKNAQMNLLKFGFSEDAVSVKIQERKIGATRDIIKEAKRGYSAVVIGRKGHSKIKGLIFGSVATKLLASLDFVPLLVVGRFPASKKVLVAMDGSDASIRTVDYLGETLRNCDCDVTLIHVIRGEEKDFMEKAKKRITPVFSMATSHLESWGFGPSHISTKIITGAVSRAGSIVREAEEGGYGTIAVGRRGISQVREFAFGRVSNKVVQLAGKQVVWVVN
ncbi:MAG: universal stress protein [Desulfatiglandaceae bacterium]|jgi:nucleotide-binding universal stress UspA family protein